MVDNTKERQKRIFEIAKELNISHIEILKYLKKEGIPCKTIMTAVDESTYEKILEEFAKEKSIVERFRKERARKEAESKRKAEEQAIKEAEEERRKIDDEIFSIARNLIDGAFSTVYDFGENIKEVLINEVIEREKVTDVLPKIPIEGVIEHHEAEKGSTEAEGEPSQTKRKQKKEKRKLRRIEISEIEARLEQRGKRKSTDAVEKTKKKSKKSKKESEIDKKKVEESIRRTIAQIDEKTRRKKYKKQEVHKEDEEDKKKIRVSEYTTVENLAHLMTIDPADIIQKCIQMGLFVTINQRLEFETIAVIADEFEFVVEQLEQYGEELLKIQETEEDIKNATPRPPVVVIMGHVDHGKTSLLDYVRSGNVVAGEAGGITQHIGAYEVQLRNKKRITFLDTPGHEAFTAMRARGAQVTDIVVLIVAADDGVMPQTVEAINHAKAAEVPIVVAINKIDKPDADIEKVKRGLSENGILVEDWGGAIQAAEISAKSGEGIAHLLDLILLEAEMLELKANENTAGRGTVIESKIDKRHGPVATILIQKGTLNVGNTFVCGMTSGHIRAIFNERGMKRKEAKPSDPVQIIGFDSVPEPADIFAVVGDDREARKIAGERQRIKREQQQTQVKEWSLDLISAQIAEGKVKQLNIVLKGDVDGSVEAISETLSELGNEEVSVSINHRAAGEITETDVLLAKASQAIIIGFNVTENLKAREVAKRENVEIRHYNVIYELVDEVKLALEGLLSPEKVEEHIGEADVRDIFKVPKLGNIAGCYMIEGKVHRAAKARVKRDDTAIYEGSIGSLKRFKDDVKEVMEGFECGIGVVGFADFKLGDHIEFFEIKSIKRTLS